MYSLDINFLKDRGLEPKAETITQAAQSQSSIADKIPIVAGAIVALILPALAFGYLKTIKAQTASIEEEVKQIEGEIASLGDQNKKIEEINQQIEQATQETSALVGVFENIRPWTAILQEVSDRTPPGVQVSSMNQGGSGEGVGLNLSGVARSYSDVNDFMLFLERSPFFDGKNIQLNTAKTGNLSVEVENEDDIPEKAKLILPEGIQYSIFAQLNNVPTSQLIEELNKRGSIGLVTRLKTLEQKGAISQ
ncbi:MAG: PilN domain-containing protein [Pleurocapsa sp.]